MNAKVLKTANELFSVESNVSSSYRKDGEYLYVKGFASVETVDRGDDIVPAQEFDVESFMAKPTLLYNHKFWIDEKGNEIAIGTVTEMYVAELAEYTEEEYGVVDHYSKEVKDYFPKAKCPDMRPGMKGLWVTAQVSVDDIAMMVERGDLNAFSWRGLSKVKYVELPDGREQKVLTEIDLFEVSLVNIPANGQATLTIAKSEDEYEYSGVDGFTVHSLRMDKTKFENVGMATAYLDGHRLQTNEMKTDGNAYFSVQKSLQEFDAESLISLRLADGVNVVAGRLKTSKSAPRGWQAEVLSTESLAHYSSLLSSQLEESQDMANKKTSRKSSAVAEPVIEETPAATTEENIEQDVAPAESEAPVETVVDETTEQETPEASVMEEVAQDQIDNASETELPDALQGLASYVGKAASESIETTFKTCLGPALENIANAMGGVNEAVTALNEKVASFDNVVEKSEEATAADNTETDTDADTETEVVAEKSQEITGEMADAMKALKSQMDAIAKSFSEHDRDEEIEKQAGPADANSCFDNLWPFTSR